MTDACPPPFPWGAALHFGLGLLRLAPHKFWSLSPVELVALSGGIAPRAFLDRASLERLMALSPDLSTKGNRDGN